MKNLLLLLLFAFVISGHGQSTENQTNTNLLSAYGYCVGLNRHLNYVSRAFQSLGADVAQARSEFSVTFGASCKVLDALIPPETKLRIAPKIDRVISRSLVKDVIEASLFLEKVRRRAKGDIHSPIKEYLLSLNPDISRQPQKEFLKGFTKNYSTKNHLKAKGVNLTIHLPFSWKRREGKRPDIIQFFTSRGLDDSSVGVALSISKVPLFKGKKLTDKEGSGFFTKEAISAFVKQDEKLIESGAFEIDNQPAGHILTDSKVTRSGIDFYSRTLTYMVFYDGSIIYISCVIGG